MIIEMFAGVGAIYAGGKLYRRKTDEEKAQNRLVNLLVHDHKQLTPAKRPSLWVKITAANNQFIQTRIDPLFSGSRHEQMLIISGEKAELSDRDQEINLGLGLSMANLMLGTIATLLYPPLLLGTLPGILYASRRLFQRAYYALVKEHRLSLYLLNSAVIGWSLFAGFIYAAAWATLLGSVFMKIFATLQRTSHQSLVNVFGQRPHFVWILVEGVETQIAFEQLQKGDIVVVNAGEVIPADGLIVNGLASIDQRALTGEAQPVEKELGDLVLAATIVLSGQIQIQVEKTGQETVATKIGDILASTSNSQLSLEKRIDRFLQWTIGPAVVLAGIAYLTVGTAGSLAILITCTGTNMGVYTLMSLLSFLHVAAQQSVLIKDATALETLVQVDAIVFDKTGTLTLEQPHVCHIYAHGGLSADELLTYVAAAEYRQTHPIAKAILAAAEEQHLTIPPIAAEAYKIGYGIKVTLNKQLIRVGSERFMALENINLPPEIKEIQAQCQAQGHTLVMAAMGDDFIGAIELQATIRPEAEQVIKQLAHKQRTIYVISGDHEQPTRTLSETLGIDHYFANTLPENKAQLVAKLQQQGQTVCFVGDGLNDTIALKQADVSISLRGATTAAIDTAQIILMDENLTHLIDLFTLTEKFKRNMENNLLIAFAPGLICIGGVFFLHFGFYAALVLNYGGFAFGLRNSMHPLLEDKKA